MAGREEMYNPRGALAGSVAVGKSSGRDAYIQLLVGGNAHRVTMTRDQLLRLASDCLQAALER